MTTKLAGLENSFRSVNRVRCFCHTLQLSAKAFLKPFQAEKKKNASDDDSDDAQDGDDDQDCVASEDIDTPDDSSLPDLLDPSDSDEEGELDDDESIADDVEDDIDELEALDAEDQEKVIEDTAAVRKTITKVCLNISATLLPFMNLLLRSGNCLSRLFTRQPSSSPLGVVSVTLTR
jgi:hypothetical protein